jgi:hypothetical protein
MNDVDGSLRVKAALDRYSSFRTFAKRVSTPEVRSPVLAKDWKPFYLKSLTPTTSVWFNGGSADEVLGLREKFSESKFALYSKLVSNFYDPDCGCEGTSG